MATTKGATSLGNPRFSYPVRAKRLMEKRNAARRMKDLTFHMRLYILQAMSGAGCLSEPYAASSLEMNPRFTRVGGDDRVTLESTSDESEDERRYKAPALEKGLDILELLACANEPMTVATIVRHLGRSTGELFRMIQVLEYRGFIENMPGSEGYHLTGKLFSLGMEQPPVKGMVEVALPHMRQLAAETGQSCHLAMHSQGQIVVVARMESTEQIGFSVRVGYRQALPSTTSGLILYAFQDDDTRQRWEALFEGLSEGDLKSFRSRATGVRTLGHAQAASSFVSGVTDLSAAILRGSTAAAALTIPFVQSIAMRHSLEEVLVMLTATSAAISNELHEADARV